MNANKTGAIVYPTGFALPSTARSGVTVLTEGDKDVAVLFGEYRNGLAKTNTYEVFKRAVDNASRVFAKDIFWITMQQRNPNLSRMKVEFLADTLEYIVSGKRRMHVRSWLPLVDDKLGGDVSPILMNGPVVHPQINLPLNDGPASLLASWLRHKDGVGDLIESTNILFGGASY